MDALGNRTRYQYDTTGSLRNVITADNAWTTYTYDWLGRMTAFTDQRENSTLYAYDEAGRLTTETTPLNEKTVRAYYERAAGGGCSSCGSNGAPGHLKSVTDPAGRTTYYAYDGLGRLTTQTYSGTSDEVDLGYDSVGRRVSMSDNRLPSADLGGQTFTWEYDKLDRMTTETYPGGGKLVYWFDCLGRRTSMTDPDGNATQYNYANDADNRKLSSIVHPFSATTTYDYISTNGPAPAGDLYGHGEPEEHVHLRHTEPRAVDHQQRWQGRAVPSGDVYVQPGVDANADRLRGGERPEHLPQAVPV